MEEKTLASEMLQELKHNNKRLFAALCIVVFLWFATIVGFVIYESQYEYADTTTETNNADIDANNDGDNSTIDISDINNG